jgi:diguanylate cyclase (GGDEF)-like protein
MVVNQEEKPIEILLVEDNPGDVRLISELLMDSAKSVYQLAHVDRLSKGAELINRRTVDVILLDLSLPDCRGLDTVSALNGYANKIPIIVLTGLNDEETAIAAVHAGAQDYLIKGQVDGNLLWRSIRYAIQRKQMEQKLAYIATHDSLTGLPNRFLLNDRLTLALTRAERNTSKLAVMMLDLDQFKNVNDVLGHNAGDEVLKAASERLSNIIRGCDTVARLGGDEFIILLTEINSANDAIKVAERVVTAFKEPFNINQNEHSVTASVGIAIFPEQGNDVDLLLKNADTAMYQVKRNGRCNYTVYGNSAKYDATM